MVRKPFMRCFWRICNSRSDNPPTRHGIPPVAVDRAGQTPAGGNAEPDFVLHPVICMPAEVPGNILVRLHFLRNHYSLCDGPTVPRMKLQQYFNTNRHTSDSAKHQEKNCHAAQKFGPSPVWHDRTENACVVIELRRRGGWSGHNSTA